MESHVYNLQLRVLLYHEDKEWVARSLELDLLGYGKTWEEAVEELKAAILAQMSFARKMNDDSLLPFPADKEYFDRWEDAQRKAIRAQILGDRCVKLAARAEIIQFSRAELRSNRKSKFTAADLTSA
jgi:hypothetical protein